LSPITFLVVLGKGILKLIIAIICSVVSLYGGGFTGIRLEYSQHLEYGKNISALHVILPQQEP